MYIDNLTITATVVFVVAVAALVRYCIIGICGLRTGDGQGGQAKPHGGDEA